ncbi:MAG TPA: hypothetical protein VF930_10775 [Stellaceae bacterium]
MATTVPASGQTKTTLREQIDRFTAGGQDDYAACAQHIALEYQWSVFLRVAPGAAVTRCARDLRTKYDEEIAALETALRKDKSAQAALRAYYVDWREIIDALKPGPQPALRANLDRLEKTAAAIRLRQAGAKPPPRYGEAAAMPSRQEPDAHATD